MKKIILPLLASLLVLGTGIFVSQASPVSAVEPWWTIEKWADQTELTLSPGQSFFVNYAVTVTNEVPNASVSCVQVYDTNIPGDGYLGEVCQDQGTETFGYSLEIGPYEECGVYIIENTASFESNTGQIGDDTWTVTVTVVGSDPTITVSAGTDGWITPSTGTVPYGSNLTYSIEPHPTYIVEDVEVNNVSQGRINSYTFGNVTSNQTISATFDGCWTEPTLGVASGVANEGWGYESDDYYATFNHSSDSVDYYGFGPLVPIGSTIDGIEVSLEGQRDSGRTWDIQLSYDGGTSWTPTTPKSGGGSFTGSDSTEIVGGPVDNWGYDFWTDTIINSDNFTVRLDATSTGGGDFILLDQVQVKVYFDRSPRAYEGHTLSALPPSLVSENESELCLGEYDSISASDDDRAWYGYTEEDHDDAKEYDYHKFEFKIGEPVSSITQIDVLHEGYASENMSAPGHSLYIWNYSNPGWEFVNSTSVQSPEQILTGTLTSGFSDYIQDGSLYLLAITNSESSCPLLYTWDGTSYQFIADINGGGGFGFSAASEGYDLKRPKSTDYVKIDGSQLKPTDGRYRLEIAEDQDEIAYLDAVKLIAVDHSPDVEIHAPIPDWYYELPPFEIHTIRNPVIPVSAIDGNGRDILPVISEVDRDCTEAHQFRFDTTTVDFGNLTGAKQIKLVYDAWVDWASGIEYAARYEYVSSHPGVQVEYMPYVEVINEDGEWERVSDEEHWGIAQAKPRTMVLDITDWFRTNDYRMRINNWYKTHIDYIAVDTSEDEEVLATELAPVSADLYWKGVSIETSPDGKQPTVADYYDIAEITGFSVYDGKFTRYGDVLPLLTEVDDKFVIIHVGDSVSISFDELPIPEGMERDYYLLSDAYYKQTFVRELLGQDVSSVEPLPFQAMSNYPYPDDESYPYDDEHMAYLEEYNTRDFRASYDESEHHTIWTDYVEVEVTTTACDIVNYISSTSGQNGAVGTGTQYLEISKPALTSPGDVLIAGITVRGDDSTIVPPSGWTLIHRENASSLSMGTYYRVADSSDDALTSYNWTLSSAVWWQRAAGGISLYTGVDPSDPIDVYGGASGQTSEAIASSVTTTVANSTVIAVFGLDDGPSRTLGDVSEMMYAYDRCNTEATGPRIRSEYTMQGIAGPTSTYSSAINPTATRYWVAQTIALKPECGGDTPPVANDNSVSTAEDTPMSFMDCQFPYSDVDGDLRTAVKIMSLPTHGTLKYLGSAFTTPFSIAEADISNLIFEPAANENGSPYTTFTFQVQAGGAWSTNTANMTINVSPVNDPPITIADCSYTTNEDTTLNIGFGGGLLANDFDIDGPSLAIHSFTLPSHGTLSMDASADGSFNYTPYSDYYGSDGFTYRATDGSAESVWTSVCILIYSANDAPVITEGDSTNVTMSEDGVPTDFSLTLHATDVEGDTLSWSISSAASHGGAVASGTGPAKVINYGPNPDYNGSDSFVVQVDDGNGGIDTITVNVTIEPVNDAPVITEGPSIGVTMSEDGVPTDFSLTLHATDVEGDTLSWSISSAASHGGAVASGTGPAKVINYAPNPNYNGSDSFVVQVDDGNSGIDTIIVNVTVEPVNDCPVIDSVSPATQTVQFSDLIQPITIVAHDIDNDLGELSLGYVPFGLSVDDSTPGTWIISGQFMDDHAMDWIIGVTDGECETPAATITSLEECVVVRFDNHNPMSVEIDDTGDLLTAEFTVHIKQDPDGYLGWADLAVNDTAMRIVPVGGGPTIDMDWVSNSDLDKFSDGAPVSFTFMPESGASFPIGTYIIEVTVNSDYYKVCGGAESLLMVYDPDVGASGAGTFEDCGDTYSFAFLVNYNKKGKNLRGSLVIIRALSGGGIYRIKSNALYDLAVDYEESALYDAGSFSGKCTYIGPDVLNDEMEPQNVGGQEFVVYLRDWDPEPGGVGVTVTHEDEFWFTVLGRDFTLDFNSDNSAGSGEIMEIDPGGDIIIPDSKPNMGKRNN